MKTTPFAIIVLESLLLMAGCKDSASPTGTVLPTNSGTVTYDETSTLELSPSDVNVRATMKVYQTGEAEDELNLSINITRGLYRTISDPYVVTMSVQLNVAPDSGGFSIERVFSKPEEQMDALFGYNDPNDSIAMSATAGSFSFVYKDGVASGTFSFQMNDDWINGTGTEYSLSGAYSTDSIVMECYILGADETNTDVGGEDEDSDAWDLHQAPVDTPPCNQYW